MIKVAHIYACNAKMNSGDFMIGIATKQYFKQNILKKDNVIFNDFDCRNKDMYLPQNILKLNSFDYILVGAGGLILPDSSPNKISCWQWIIHKDTYKLITSPIYVISIGFNLFYGQTINMQNHNNNSEDKTRSIIFKENICELINKSVHFSMRHHQDIKSLLDVIGQEYINKIKYEVCPTVWYVDKFWKPKFNQENKNFIAIEIKDDREWRRYHKIGKNYFYAELEKFVNWCLLNNKKICYLSHDGSKNFYKYLLSRNIKIPLLDNSVSNESKILDNYSQIHTILCSAGHSQMISYGLNIRTISLISHPKLKYFCEDVKNSEFIEINKDTNVFEKLNTYVQ